MSTSAEIIPVVLLAYARPVHLRRVLACLKANKVPLLYAFVDGPRGKDDAVSVSQVVDMLREIDWCEVRLTERQHNMGLGENVRASVGEIVQKHDAFIVWEDDLICVPGTYVWMCAALRAHADDPRVMSVSAWTHPKVTPADVGDMPYFDARAECWVWGAWARSWRGMADQTASEKMRLATQRGVAPGDYGADLPRQARDEKRRNVWAVRWLYHHFQYGGLCVRPPWSMVEHIGFDASATNAAGATEWANPPLRTAPPIPTCWPEAKEHAECRRLWRRANPRRWRRGLGTVKRLVPEWIKVRFRLLFGWRWFRGDYATWAEARSAASGYEDGVVLRRVLDATLAVRAGLARFERDSVLFHAPDPDRPLVAVLEEIVRERGGALRVLDFGGSLGSTYWRHRDVLPSGERLRWDVVEQPSFVEAGKRHLADTPIRFYAQVEAARLESAYDVLLCSCVLQYLESPFEMLESWRHLDVPYLLLNNLPLDARGPDRLRVQHVPPAIYPASYPVWFFNRKEFLNRVSKDYSIVKEFDAEAVWPVGWGMFQSTGLLLKRREGA